MWYFANKGREDGPYAQSYLERLIRERKLDAYTLIWRDGYEDWKELRDSELAQFLPLAGGHARCEEECAEAEVVGREGRSAEAAGSVDPGTRAEPVDGPSPRLRQDGSRVQTEAKRRLSDALRRPMIRLTPLAFIIQIILLSGCLFDLSWLLFHYVPELGFTPGWEHVPVLKALSSWSGLPALPFLAWLGLALRNLPAMGGQSSKIPYLLVVFSLFVPLVGLVLPGLVFLHLWTETHRKAGLRGGFYVVFLTWLLWAAYLETHYSAPRALLLRLLLMALVLRVTQLQDGRGRKPVST